MRISVFLSFLFLFSLAQASDYVLIGSIPGEYIGKSEDQFHLGMVIIKGKTIQEVRALNSTERHLLRKNPHAFIDNFTEEKEVLLLKRAGGAGYDAIYPGFIDLHNHASRNFFPAWEEARGQFSNRYDWRNNRDYKLTVASNSGPWLKAENALSCAAFRWNELQAMTLGTTYLQGHRVCSKNFAIHQAELTSAYGSEKKKVSAPSDLFAPDTMLYIWKDLKPYMKEKSLSFDEALAQQLNSLCVTDPQFTKENIFSQETVENKIINKDWLYENCQISRDIWDGEVKKSCRPKSHQDWVSESKPERMMRYLQCGHANLAKRRRYLDDPQSSAFLFHLSEGRRDDSYNQIEFEMLKLIGFDRAHIGLVHGLGLSSADYDHMVQKKMGLIWSPYSNLLLYGQTLDFSKLNKELIMAIGSDWTPTGTKSLLEEVKIARNYLHKVGKGKSWLRNFSDKALYKMMTVNPAKIINAQGHIGTLQKEAMASLIVTSVKSQNPYTNIVRDTHAEGINLVLVDGQVIYGNKSYLKQADYSEEEYELMPRYVGEGMKDWVLPDAAGGFRYKYEDLPSPPAQLSQSSALEKWAYNLELGNWVQNNREKFHISSMNREGSYCQFSQEKAFVTPVNKEDTPQQFYTETGLNLNRFLDIQMLLSVALMTQNGNIHDKQWGKIERRMSYFPSLFTCNDKKSYERQRDFIKLQSEGEFSRNKSHAHHERSAADELCRAFDVCTAH